MSSVASSFPYSIKIPQQSSPSSSSSQNPSSSSSYSSLISLSSRSPATRRPFAGACRVVRSSQTEGPIRRPVAPPATPPLSKPEPPPPSRPEPPASAAPPPKPDPGGDGDGGKGVVTLEFQRAKAKELQEYFKQKKLDEANTGPFFGFLGKNEISNGRWAMFGFAVGLLTEYATGSDLVDQVKILLSNFGILDLE